MTRLRIGILDLVARAPSTALWSRVMNPNFASVMPQAIAVWCEQDGHDVHYVCYTGSEILSEILPRDIDVLFIGAFTEAAQLSYAISALFRARGAITVLGGPHARCYPEECIAILRLRAGVHGPRDDPRCNPRARAASADGHADERRAAAHAASRRAAAVEVHRPHAREGEDVQARAHDREPRMSVHLLVLHRFDGRLSGDVVRPALHRSPLSAHGDGQAVRRLAGSQLRRAIRRDARRDRGGGAPGEREVRGGEQPVAPVGAEAAAAAQERLPRHAPRRGVLVLARQQVAHREHLRRGQGAPGGRAREHDPAVHPVRPDELRLRARLR